MYRSLDTVEHYIIRTLQELPEELEDECALLKEQLEKVKAELQQ